MELSPDEFMRGIPYLRGAKEYLTCLSDAIRLSAASKDFDLALGSAQSLCRIHCQAFRPMPP